MDEYQGFKPDQADWKAIAEQLTISSIVTFPYSGDNYTSFIITIAGPITNIGLIPWGGQVRGSFLVALRARSSEYFDLTQRDSDLHPDYVGEKLDLVGSDAEIIAQLLNQLTRLL